MDTIVIITIVLNLINFTPRFDVFLLKGKNYKDLHLIDIIIVQYRIKIQKLFIV